MMGGEMDANIMAQIMGDLNHKIVPVSDDERGFIYFMNTSGCLASEENCVEGLVTWAAMSLEKRFRKFRHARYFLPLRAGEEQRQIPQR